MCKLHPCIPLLLVTQNPIEIRSHRQRLLPYVSLLLVIQIQRGALTQTEAAPLSIAF